MSSSPEISFRSASGENRSWNIFPSVVKFILSSSLAALAGIVSGAYILALSYFSANLTRTTFLQFYVSEWVAVICLCLLLGLGPSRLWAFAKSTWIALLFSLFCVLVWAAPDFLALLREHASLGRFVRHSVLYVYPAIWFPLGFAFRAYLPVRVFQILIWGLWAAQMVSGLLATSPHNFAIGPIFTFLLPVSFLVPQALGWFSQHPLRLRVFRVMNTLAFLFPFATAALITQRSTFINTICDFSYGMLLSLRMLGRSWLRTILTTVVAVIVLLACSWPPANMSMQKSRLTTFLSDQLESYKSHIEKSPSVMLFGAYQHADDFAYKDGKSSVFQFRFRRELWSQAWKDWQISPIFGQGFRIEVPSSVFGSLNMKYPHNQSDLSFLPISGPHNSFLNILVRTGVVGALLWMAMLVCWYRRIYPFIWKPGHITLAMAFACIGNGLIYSFFNLGLEGPEYAIPIYFLLGATFCHCGEEREKKAA